MPTLKKKKQKANALSEDTQAFINECKDFVQLGSECKRRRLENGLTVQELASQAGISPAFITQVENGVSAPGLLKLDRLAEVYDFPWEFVRIMNFKRRIQTLKGNVGLGHIAVDIDWTTTKTFVKG